MLIYLLALAGTAALANQNNPMEDQSAATRVIVVGGGLAGFSAALTAASNGASVLLLEKEKSVGGNSAKATSGMNSVGSAAQAAAGIVDTPEMLYSDTVASGHGHTDPALARTLSVHAKEALEWLRGFGVDLNAVTLCGGHGVPRTHHEAPRADGKPTPVGWDIISALRKAAEANPNISIRTNACVTALVQEEAPAGAAVLRGSLPIIGVRYRGPPAVATSAAAVATAATAISGNSSSCGGATGEEHFEPADAVVLTTGGYGNDHSASGSLMAQFAPQLARLPTTNGAFTTGDGIKLARAAGAFLRGMRHVQVHPTAFVDPANPGATTKFLGPEALRGAGGVLLNHRGVRFVDELGRRDHVTAAMYWACAEPGAGTTSQAEQAAAAAAENAAGAAAAASPSPSPVQAYVVLPAAAAARFPNFAFYSAAKGFFRAVSGPAGVAAAIGPGATAEAVAATLREYAAAAAGSARDPFGKSAFPDAFAGAAEPGAALWVATVTPAVHYCMGGVATSAAGELLFADALEDPQAAGVAAAAAAAGDVRDVASADPAAVESAAAERAVARAAAAAAAVAASQSASAPVAAVPDNFTLQALLPGPPPLPGSSAASAAAAPGSSEEEAEAQQQQQLAAAELALLDAPPLRAVPRLFGAGEVTGGLHGGNRLAGNSLLECCVFGRLAGARAAAVGLRGPALSPDAYTPLELREVHALAPSVSLFRFNLPSPLQRAGLAAGQYVAVRAAVGGRETVRFYSPVSRAEACGVLDLLLKADGNGGAGGGGAMSSHVASLRPGDTLDFRGPLGGVSGGRLDFDPAADGGLPVGRVRKIGLIAGGTGIAPMLQILRSIFHFNREDVSTRLIYAAATPEQLACLPLLRRKAALHAGNFSMACTVDSVPAGCSWDGAVGVVSQDLVKTHMWAPEEGLLVVICGPYPMCQALKTLLPTLGYSTDMLYSFM